jgi:hypothetical protein
MLLVISRGQFFFCFLFFCFFVFWGVEPPHRVEQSEHGGGMPRGERPLILEQKTKRWQLSQPHNGSSSHSVAQCTLTRRRQ